MVRVHRSGRSRSRPWLPANGSLLLRVVGVAVLSIWFMESPPPVGLEDDKTLIYYHHLEHSSGRRKPAQPHPAGAAISASTTTRIDGDRPNILFLITDQQRFDTIRRVQDELWYYENATKIQTPNLDRLSRIGAYFETAYTQCAVCAPARTTLRTGCTVERTGVQRNTLTEEPVYGESSLFTQRVEALEGLDKILKRYGGYINEYYGKWHMPQRLWNSIESNDYDYHRGTFEFDGTEKFTPKYRRFLNHFEKQGNISNVLDPGMQRDTLSTWPYSPVEIDSRYNRSTGLDLHTADELKWWQKVESSQAGVSKFGHEYSSSSFFTNMATKALDRLVAQREQDGINHGRPFALTVSFHSPHPPMIASPEHFQKYAGIRSKNRNLLVPPSLHDDLQNSAYSYYDNIASQDPNYHNEEMVQKWTAVYYALIEEIDERIGVLLEHLGNQASNTLIIFTSDHGEMLGAHGMRGKSNFYEESSRVPLLISWPGVIPERTVVKEAVSHLDIFATILDYVGLSRYDGSDGSSLRPLVEGRSYNADYDEDVVVSEWDGRMPDEDDPSKLSPRIDKKPALMIRKGSYKLMTQKLAKSDRMDMMFNLKVDPFELNNLLGHNAVVSSVSTREKAEHLRCLLLDWMQRMDGADPYVRYYSDPGANYWEGRGDIEEVRRRQSWPALDFWVSDSKLKFGRLVWDGLEFVRNEYLYLGTRAADETKSGSAEIAKISIVGRDSAFFRIQTDDARGADDLLPPSVNKSKKGSPVDMVLYKNQCGRIKVSLSTKSSSLLPSTLDASLRIERRGAAVREVMLWVSGFGAGTHLSYQ